MLKRGLANYQMSFRACVMVLGSLAILTGLFLSERPDQPGLGLGHQDCVDPTPPALNRLPASQSLAVQINRLLFHSGDN